MTNTLKAVAVVTKTLGHCGRLRILCMLRPGPLSVCQIASWMGISTLASAVTRLPFGTGDLVVAQSRQTAARPFVPDVELGLRAGPGEARILHEDMGMMRNFRVTGAAGA